MATPIQAVLPTFPTLADEIRFNNKAKPANIDPPRIFTLTGGSDVVFDARAGAADKKFVSKLILHNLGANPMKYALNQDAQANSFHDILAGGSVVLDGLGSLVDLSKDQPDYVSVIGTAGEKIAVVISYPIDAAIN